MTRKRSEFSRETKRLAWQRADGHCERCTAPLFAGHYRYDHDIPDALGGANTLDNCVVACDACDTQKTYRKDIPAIAKMKRQRDMNIGAGLPTSRPLPGTFASGIKLPLGRDVPHYRDSGRPVFGRRT